MRGGFSRRSARLIEHYQKNGLKKNVKKSAGKSPNTKQCGKKPLSQKRFLRNWRRVGNAIGVL